MDENLYGNDQNPGLSVFKLFSICDLGTRIVVVMNPVHKKLVALSVWCHFTLPARWKKRLDWGKSHDLTWPVLRDQQARHMFF